MVKVRLLISGRVQGVYYRHSTRQRACELALVGWVRNLENGKVEVEAQGKPESVEALIAWCRQGPPSARVDACEVTWLPVQDEPTSPDRVGSGVFEIC